MKLIPEAGRIAATSFSMICNYIGLALLIIPAVLIHYGVADFDPAFLGWCAIAVLVAGTGGRLIKQEKRFPVFFVLALIFLFAMAGKWSDGVEIIVEPDAAEQTSQLEPERAEVVTLTQAGADEFDALALPFIRGWEGHSNEAYLDIVGVPTICSGSTRGVKMGDHLTDAECDALLIAEIHEYREGVRAFFTTETLLTRLPVKRDVAFTSFAYNVGIYGAGNSTAVRRLNAANVAGACQAMTWWNRAGKRIIRGLVNRRTAEFHLCMADMA